MLRLRTAGGEIHEVYERAVRDLPWSEFRTTVLIELYRVKCPGLRGQGGEGAAVAEQGAIQQALRGDQWDKRARVRRRGKWRGGSVWRRARCGRSICGIWSDGLATRRKPALRQMGVDEIHLGKKQKFLTVVCNLETSEPLWFGRERKKETLDTFFQEELSARQRRGIEAACVDMWEPFRLSIEQWAPNCRIVYDKFHIMQHANQAIDEVRRAEFFRKGGQMREVGEREALAAAEPVDPPDGGQAPRVKPAIRPQPESL